MRAFKTGLGSTLLLLLAGTGCGQAEREPPETQTSARALQNGPDFVVTAVTGPPSVLSGQSFTAQVTVCNRGNVSDNTEVELYLSADATIRPNSSTNSEDRLVTGAVVPTLGPNQCTTLSLSGPAYAPAPVSPLGDNGFYLGAVVDPRNTRAELDESNNALAGKRLGVGSKPDFTVTAVTGPASVLAGQQLTAQVTVCNQGTQSQSTEVELYLSVDDIIRPKTSSSSSSEDKPIGLSAVPTLAPGQCTTLAVSGPAYAPGSSTPPPDQGYYLGAAVDPRNTRAELLEDNNTLAGKRLGVGNKPDFTVTAVTGPASVRDGQPLSAQVTVCNQGTASASTQVALYLSPLPTLRPNPTPASAYTQVASAPVPTLFPGQCTTLPLSGPAFPPASSAPGEDRGFYLGAVVDPSSARAELLEDNNALVGKRLGVGTGADFLVTAITGPASVRPGDSFTAQVTVCNQGTASASTEVELYLSADATVRPNTGSAPPEDFLVSRAFVPTLAPGQCSSLPLSGPASPPSGPDGASFENAFYLGAVVDPFNSRPELLEDNNTTVGSRLGVGSRPDFVVTAVTAPASVRLGDSFTTQVTVCNQGTRSDSTELELYLSADATVRPNTGAAPPEDFLVTGVSVPTLVPSQCLTLSLSGPAQAPPGSGGSSAESAFYLGAVVDPRNTRPELLEDNDILVGKRLGVGSRPDFVVTSITGPASVRPGESLTAQVTVCNQGTSFSNDTSVTLYLSADTTVRPDGSSSPPEDSKVNWAPVPPLQGGQCATVPVSGPAYAPSPNVPVSDSGSYLGAIVDADNTLAELLEDNNTLVGKRLGVGTGADFVITAVTGPASVRPGQTLSAQVTVCNQGNQSDSTEVELYLSADALVRANTGSAPPEDVLVAGVSVPTLAPGQCLTQLLSGPAYPPPGASAPSPDQGYYLGAVVDPRNTRPELLEDNNTLVGKRLGVGTGADFVITAVTGPASVRPGQTLSAQVTVCNQGNQSDSTEVELYLSADTTLRPHTPSTPSEDLLLAWASVPMLTPGQCSTLPLSGSASPPPPTASSEDSGYYLGAVVDPRNTRPELLEDNNTTVGKRLGVGDRPDFVVTAVTGPASVPSDQPFTAQVTVCNQGTQEGSTDVTLYLSADATLRPSTPLAPTEDLRVTSAPVPVLAPGQCATLPLSGNASVPMGPPPSRDRGYYLGAAVDAERQRPELLEDNNLTVGKRMGIGTGADFVVTAVTGPASVRQGESFTAQVTVCNQGTASDSTEVDLVLSADTTLQPSTSQTPSEDWRVTSASVPTLAPGQCLTLSLSGPASAPGPSGDNGYYLGALVDARNTRPELLEDNNATLGNVLVLR